MACDQQVRTPSYFATVAVNRLRSQTSQNVTITAAELAAVACRRAHDAEQHDPAGCVSAARRHSQHDPLDPQPLETGQPYMTATAPVASRISAFLTPPLNEALTKSNYSKQQPCLPGP